MDSAREYDGLTIREWARLSYRATAETVRELAPRIAVAWVAAILAILIIGNGEKLTAVGRTLEPGAKMHPPVAEVGQIAGLVLLSVALMAVCLHFGWIGPRQKEGADK